MIIKGENFIAFDNKFDAIKAGVFRLSKAEQHVRLEIGMFNSQCDCLQCFCTTNIIPNSFDKDEFIDYNFYKGDTI